MPDFSSKVIMLTYTDCSIQMVFRLFLLIAILYGTNMHFFLEKTNNLNWKSNVYKGKAASSLCNSTLLPRQPLANTHTYTAAELLGIHDKQFENHQNLDHS